MAPIYAWIEGEKGPTFSAFRDRSYTPVAQSPADLEL